MQLTSPDRAPGEELTRTGQPKPRGTYIPAIEGRFRRITTHQIAMAWWLHSQGHITRRQLRIYFAAHEMAERRRYTDEPKRTRPRYGIEEVQSLVGGRGSVTARREIAADLRHLARLGLVTMSEHALDIARSIEQIRGLSSLEEFWSFFHSLPNNRRTIPVPRRTLRALAAGWSRAVTAYALALLLRSVFWHRRDGGGGEYRVDGRTKLSWVAEVFGVSRRALTDARQRLVELGWLEPQETTQWALNKWGTHDIINVHWTPNASETVSEPENEVSRAVGEGRGSGESASPSSAIAGESASPLLNRSLLSSRESETRKLGGSPRSPSGVSMTGGGRKNRPRRKAAPKEAKATGPDLRDVQPQDLRDPEALLKLYQQAIGSGLAKDCSSSRLDFFALAERACSHGANPPALFTWLLKSKKFQFITQADEDAAAARLRKHFNGPNRRRASVNTQEAHSLGDLLRSGGVDSKRSPADEDDERFFQICVRVAKQQRIADPFSIAKAARGWSRLQWETIELSSLSKYSRAHDGCVSSTLRRIPKNP